MHIGFSLSCVSQYTRWQRTLITSQWRVDLNGNEKVHEGIDAQTDLPSYENSK